jgi:hypothetical protein
MPTGDLLVPIFSLVRYMVGIEFEFDIRIYLRKSDVPLCQLGQRPMQTMRPCSAGPPGSLHQAMPTKMTFFLPFQEHDLKLVKF